MSYQVNASEALVTPEEWGNLSYIYESDNLCDLNYNESDLKAVKAYICFDKNFSSKNIAKVFFQEENSARILRLDFERSDEVPSHKRAELDVLDFCESLGFLMKNLNFERLDVSEKQTIVTKMKFLDQSVVNVSLNQLTSHRVLGEVKHQEAIKIILAAF